MGARKAIWESGAQRNQFSITVAAMKVLPRPGHSVFVSRGGVGGLGGGGMLTCWEGHEEVGEERFVDDCELVVAVADVRRVHPCFCCLEVEFVMCWGFLGADEGVAVDLARGIGTARATLGPFGDSPAEEGSLAKGPLGGGGSLG